MADKHGLTDDELAMLTPEEREGLLDEEEEEEIEEGQEQEHEEEHEEEEPKVAATEEEPAPAKKAAAQQENEPEPAETPDPLAKPAPRPLFNAEVPEDLEAKRQALDTQEEALVTQFDDGDITFSEYNKQLRAINRDRSVLDRAELKAELAQESAQSQQQQSWDNDQRTFFAQHPEIDLSDPVVRGAFDHYLREATKPVMEKGYAIGMREIEAAYGMFAKRFNITPESGQQPKPAPAAKIKGKQDVIPPVLAGIPAAATTNTDDGKWAHLDRLMDADPIAFESALAKLSDAERDEYMQAE